MVNQNLLDGYCAMSGMRTNKDIADILGITEQSYINKKKGYQDFKGGEIKLLIERLSIPEDKIVETFFV